VTVAGVMLETRSVAVVAAAAAEVEAAEVEAAGA
jgi:hypothetical protein